MTLKAGERVEYKEAYMQAAAGDRGTVQDIDTAGHAWVKLDSSGEVQGGYASRLKRVDTFTYDDIQVGDKIRRTLTRETGTTEVREGTVVSKNGGLAVDRDGPLSYILAYSSDGHPDKKSVVLELLDRPKPKHWTETKPVGSVAVILDGTFTKTLKKTSEFGWNVLFAEDGYTYKDTNKAIELRVSGVDESKIHWIK